VSAGIPGYSAGCAMAEPFSFWQLINSIITIEPGVAANESHQIQPARHRFQRFTLPPVYHHY
jgi:hypothetical protein